MAVGDELGFKGNATGQSTHTKTVLREPAHNVGSAPGIIAVQKCFKHFQAFMVSHRRIPLLTPQCSRSARGTLTKHILTLGFTQN
jgi:hypothetical protein